MGGCQLRVNAETKRDREECEDVSGEEMHVRALGQEGSPEVEMNAV